MESDIIADLRQKFGQRLRFLRRNRDITQMYLAELIDRSPNFVTMMEVGNASPSFETLAKLMKVLDVDASELFQFDDTPPKRRRQKEG